MSGSRLVRGTRSRLFLYLGVVAVVGLAVYVFHGAQLQLDDARKAADKCQQQQESLSAQLQVIFEYKLRLEKSLQQEKTEHRQTREELEAQAVEEKARRDKESLEASNKHAALAQQYKLLQSQHEDLSEDCKKIRVEQLHGLEERGKLEAQLQQVQASHKKSLSSLKSEYLKLEVENEHLHKQHDELLKGSSHTSDRIGYLEKQNLQLKRELEKAQKELDTYKKQHPLRSGETKQHNEDETLKSPERAVPSPSSPSSASSAAPDAGLNPDNQNVLQEPVVNQDDNLENKVRSSTSSSNALPVGEKLPGAKSSSQAMGLQSGNNYFLAPVSRAAPAMYVPDGAIAVPPHEVSIEQLQRRLDQILKQNELPQRL